MRRPQHNPLVSGRGTATFYLTVYWLQYRHEAGGGTAAEELLDIGQLPLGIRRGGVPGRHKRLSAGRGGGIPPKKLTDSARCPLHSRASRRSRACALTADAVPPLTSDRAAWPRLRTERTRRLGHAHAPANLAIILKKFNINRAYTFNCLNYVHIVYDVHGSIYIYVYIHVHMWKSRPVPTREPAHAGCPSISDRSGLKIEIRRSIRPATACAHCHVHRSIHMHGCPPSMAMRACRYIYINIDLYIAR